jgi:outer membrane protein assembly factor BamB
MKLGFSYGPTRVVFFLYGFFLFQSGTPAADQPQWGQRYTRNMVSEEKGLPQTFDPKTGRNIKWVATLGTQTYGTPVIAQGKVLIGTNNDRPRDPRHQGDSGVLMCLDEKDGGLCWQLIVPKEDPDPYLEWPHTGIVSPVTVEGQRVYLVSNRNEVMCLDLRGQANGNDGPYLDENRHMTRRNKPLLEVSPLDADILWLFNLKTGAGVHPHDAAHCSPLLDEDFLYVCTSNGVDGTHLRMVAPEAPSLVVLDKNRGCLVARDNEHIGPMTIHSTWSSPALGEVNGRRLIFFCGGDACCYAFESLKGDSPLIQRKGPVSGSVAHLKRVWKFDCDPTAPKINILQWQDNRREGPSNITGMPVFYKNRIYVTHGGDVWHGKPQCWLKCIDAAKTGEITKEGLVWSAPLDKHCMSTPAVYGGLVFIGDSGRKIHCLDADTGREFWTHQTRGEIWASPLVADGKVYVGTLRGDLWVLAAAREKKVLGHMDLGEPINGTPVAANGTLYITTMQRLLAIKAR